MKKYTYSDEIANVVKRFLIEDDWHYSFDENTGVFEFGLRIRSKLQKIKYILDVHEDDLVVYGITPIGADRDDAEMMARMAEFICRANYGLKNGNFEFDFRDGEIRYKCYIDCEEIVPSTEIVSNCINCTAAMIKRYAPGIVDIIFTGGSAKDAIEKCERPPEDELRSMLGDLGEDTGGDVTSMIERLAERLGVSIGDGEGGDGEGADTAAADEAAEDMLSKKDGGAE